MTSDLAVDYLEESLWFEHSTDYIGHGRAYFKDPRIILNGDVQIRFHSSSRANAEMKVKTVNSLGSYPLGMFQWFTSKKPSVNKGSVSLDFGEDDFNSNPCIRLVVDLPDGSFGALESIGYSVNYSMAAGQETTISIAFDLFRAQFDSSEYLEPRYWVLPLSNFVSSFYQNHESYDYHPLRLANDRTDGYADEDLYALARQRLIAFEHNDEFAFIVPLPDYNARATSLGNGSERNLVTALMVGEVDIEALDSEGIMKAVPVELLRLLSLATGTEVGAPWIELRDADGNLTQCTHISLGSPVYSPGRAAIDEVIHKGIGPLLSKAPRSQHYFTSELQVAMKHIVQCGLPSMGVEDRLIHGIRAFECLIRLHDLDKALDLPETVGSAITERLRSVVQDCLSTIGEMKRSLDPYEYAKERSILERVHGKARDALLIRPSFGQNLVALSELHEFPDGSVIDEYLKEQGKPSGRNRWNALISKYRAVALHNGYLDFASGEFDPVEAYALVTHMRDLLLRLVLKLQGYEGYYQPAVRTLTVKAKYDWVTKDTPASMLGFR